MGMALNVPLSVLFLKKARQELWIVAINHIRILIFFRMRTNILFAASKPKQQGLLSKSNLLTLTAIFFLMLWFSSAPLE